MAANSWATIRVPRPVFDRQNRRRRDAGRTWAAHLDAVAPDPPSRADVFRQAVREEIEAVLADADLEELTGTEPEPLEPLIEKGGNTCLICGEECNATGRAIVHLLTEHSDEVNERHAEVDRRRRENGEVARVEWASSQNGDDPMTVNPDGPVSYFDTPTAHPGQAWGNGHLADARECDIGGPDCQGRMSKEYARVFAREEDGRLACPNCLSRSARYSADHAERSDARTDPANVTGQANPNAAVPHGEVTPDG